MSVQRIRLPSVNDIFPKAETHLMSCTGPAPQLVHSFPVEAHANYTAIQQPTAYTIQHPHPAHIQHSHPHQQAAGPIAQPIPFYPQNFAPTQQHPTSNSPIDYNIPSKQIPVYHYQQPRHHHLPQHHQPQQQHHQNGVIMGSVMTQHKYKISKNSSVRQSNAWSSNDDELLKYLKEVKNLGWREISMYFDNRTANGCQFRWRRIVALSKQQESFQGTIKRRLDGSSENSRSNSLESLLN